MFLSTQNINLDILLHRVLAFKLFIMTLFSFYAEHTVLTQPDISPCEAKVVNERIPVVFNQLARGKDSIYVLVIGKCFLSCFVISTCAQK